MHRAARWLLLLLLCAGLHPPMARAQSDAVDAYITAEMEKRHVPGLALAVVRDGEDGAQRVSRPVVVGAAHRQRTWDCPIFEKLEPRQTARSTRPVLPGAPFQTANQRWIPHGAYLPLATGLRWLPGGTAAGAQAERRGVAGPAPRHRPLPHPHPGK